MSAAQSPAPPPLEAQAAAQLRDAAAHLEAAATTLAAAHPYQHSATLARNLAGLARLQAADLERAAPPPAPQLSPQEATRASAAYLEAATATTHARHYLERAHTLAALADHPSAPRLTVLAQIAHAAAAALAAALEAPHRG